MLRAKFSCTFAQSAGTPLACLALTAAETGHRTVVFDDGPHDTPVFWRDYMPINMGISGPAIIEQMDCTTLVEPGDVARGDAGGNIIIEVGGL